MRRQLTSITIALALGSGLLFAGGAATAARTVPRSSTTPRLVTCAGRTQFKPSSYIVTCANHSSVNLLHIRWRTWNTLRATATATYRTNNCVPRCSSGKVTSYSSTTEFSAPKRVKLGVVFSKLNVVVVIGKRSYTFTYSLPLKRY